MVSLKIEDKIKKREQFDILLKQVTDLYMEIEPCETMTDKELSLEERITLAEELLWQWVESNIEGEKWINIVQAFHQINL